MPVNEATRRAIDELEDGLQQALLGPDLGWFNDHWAPDAIYVHLSGGVDDTAAFVDRLRTKKTVYRSRERGDVTIREYGTTAVVTGWTKVDIIVAGTDRLLDTRFTRTYVREGDRWVLVSSQSGGNTAAAATITSVGGKTS
jgi:hypothetical protein